MASMFFSGLEGTGYHSCSLVTGQVYSIGPAASMALLSGVHIVLKQYTEGNGVGMVYTELVDDWLG